MEAVEQLSPAQPNEDQDALLHTPGERVSARMFDLQVVELHVRIALLNRFNQVGRPQTVPVAVVA